jgi:hypothetical protein
MTDGCKCYLDSLFATKVHEISAIELLTVIYCYVGWDSEMANNLLPDETDQGAGGDFCQSLGLYPF